MLPAVGCDLVCMLSCRQGLAETIGIQFIETSAKSATNVEEAFLTMAAEIKRRVGPSESTSAANQRSNVKVNASTPVKSGSSSGCC